MHRKRYPVFFIYGTGIWKAEYPVLSKESTLNIQLGICNRWPEAFLRTGTLENANELLTRFRYNEI